MGSYRRKVYKKKSRDLFHEKGLKGMIKDEVNFFNNSEEEPDGKMIFDDNPVMLDEPEIVKELREEERLGKLQTLIMDIPETKEQHSAFTKIESLEIFEEPKIKSKKGKNTSYNDTLVLAKKVLKKIYES